MSSGPISPRTTSPPLPPSFSAASAASAASTAPPADRAQHRRVFEVLAAAALLGILGDSLLRSFPWGLNVAVCVSASVAAAVVLVLRHRPHRPHRPRIGPEAPALALTALLLAAAFVRHASEWLGVFDVAALALVAAMAMKSVQGVRLAALGVSHHIRTAGDLVRVATLDGLALVFRDTPWRDVLGGGRGGQVRSIGLGLVIAAPILVIFGALLSSADVVFATVLDRLLVVNPQSAMGHLLGWSMCALAAGGYLGALSAACPPRGPAQTRAVHTIGGTTVVTALVLVDLLFLLFVVIQLRYLFGGQDLVLETTGLTLAEYARSGFFELVTLSAFSLPLLLGADWAMREQSPSSSRLFRQLAGLTLVMIGIIMASALERMRLYMAEFGLSAFRVVATAFMIYLFLLFAWFAWTVLRGRRRRFTWGGVLLGFAVLAGLHVLNPDALAARVNMDRAAHGHRFDSRYASGALSADAVPVILDRMSGLPLSYRCEVADGLLDRWTTAEIRDWRSWNWSRARARRLVNEHALELRDLLASPACRPAPGR
jgi:hypothetical protein